MISVAAAKQLSKLSSRPQATRRSWEGLASTTTNRWVRRRRPASTAALSTMLSSSPGCTQQLDAASMTRFNNTTPSSVNNNRCRLFSSAAAAAAPEEDEEEEISSSFNNKSSDHNNVIPFNLSDIGEGIAEVEILQWYVGIGDHVREFDPICEVQSDKATVEIPSRYEGTITQLEGGVGDMIQTGSPLFYIATSSKTVLAAGSTVVSSHQATEAIRTPPQSSSSQPSLNNSNPQEDAINIPPPPVEQPTNNDESPTKGKFLASPAVRKLGRDHGLDLSTLTGTGPKGRALKGDVLKVIGALSADKQDTDADDATTTTTQADAVDDETTTTTVVPIRGYNRLMIKTMTESLQIPHMGYGDEVNMNALMECRRQVATKEQGRLSVLVYCIKATSLALLDYPQLNSILCTDTMTLKQSSSHHIGIAMDTPRGLAVPIVRNVESLSLLEISAELNRLKELAKDGALSEQDVGAGTSSSAATFTLSNIGAVGGGTYMSPVVAPPQVGIGAMGKVRRLPRFVDNGEDDSLEVEAAHMMNISWAADHRAVDGATLARFSNAWKAYLESPTSMMMKMK